ncbi:kinase-like domain-containing protein [Flammula alnicola]|nr:kinase-like domain-containing protein [Flammula alnicola]
MSRVLLHLWLSLPSAMRLRAYQALIKIGDLLYDFNGSPKCFRLPFGLYAKVGYNVLMAEANVMRYLKAHTTMLIPSVVDAIPVPSGAFIVMTRLDGEPLLGKLEEMSEQQLASFAEDLKSNFAQLRAVPQPKDGPRISGWGGGNLRAGRIESTRIGPFSTERDLYDYMISMSHIMEQERLKVVARELHSTPHQIVLSHGDIHPTNLLVDRNNKLSGIIDWECCAWMPDYWDWTNLHFPSGKDGYPEWKVVMNTVFGTYPDALKVEMELWKYNDPW